MLVSVNPSKGSTKRFRSEALSALKKGVCIEGIHDLPQSKSHKLEKVVAIGKRDKCWYAQPQDIHPPTQLKKKKFFAFWSHVYA